MPGRWEERYRTPPLTVRGLTDPPQNSRTERFRVWIEDPPIAGIREFTSDRRADQLRHLIRAHEQMTRGRRDSWTAREAHRISTEIDAIRHECGEPQPRFDSRAARAPWYDYETSPFGNYFGVLDPAEYLGTFTSTTGTTTARTSATTATTGTSILYESLEQLRREIMRAPAPARNSRDDFVDTYRGVALQQLLRRPTEPKDPAMADIYSGSPGNYVDSYVAVEYAPDKSVYWQTDGAIESDRVALVLSRYYQSPDRVRLLFNAKCFPTEQDKGNSRDWLCCNHLHPDPAKLSGLREGSWISTSAFIDGTGGSNFASKTFLWRAGVWSRRNRITGGYKVLDPHE